MTTFQEKIQKYADVVVKVGADFQSGQRLWIRAPLEARELTLALTRSAYRAGAMDVFVEWLAPALDQIRLQDGSDEAVKTYPEWLSDVMTQHVMNGDANITIRCDDPAFFASEDPARIKIFQQARAEMMKPVREASNKDLSNGVAVMAPHPASSALLFPNLSPEEAREKHWETIFQMCRIEGNDPVQDWRDHINALVARANYLNDKKYSALHYKSPVTDLTIGLPDGHTWQTARFNKKNGTNPVVNIPTEEVFTMPHKDRVDGVVKSTKPLSWNGTIIDNFTLLFSEGAVVSAVAEQGQEALDMILSTDAGARSVGEIALVPHSSPISQSGLLFFNTLYDENASNHLALGQAYRISLEGGREMSEEEFAEAGGNNSLIHVDFMMGSGDMHVDGVLADGTTDPVMRQGEWAFEV